VSTSRNLGVWAVAVWSCVVALAAAGPADASAPHAGGQSDAVQNGTPVGATAADGFTGSVGKPYCPQLHIYGMPVETDVPSGVGYAGIASKATGAENGADFLGGVAAIRGGVNAGAETTISMAWRTRTDIEVSYINSDTGEPYPVVNRLQYPPLAWGAYNMVSDIVKVTGVNGPYVLQMDYDENELIYVKENYTEELFAHDGCLYVGWFEQEGPGSALGALPDQDEWVRATLGNSTQGAKAVFNFRGSFDQFLLDHPDFDPSDPNDMNDYLGATGVDIVDDRVWAILDHSGQFGAVPEPATVSLLAVGGLALMRRRR